METKSSKPRVVCAAIRAEDGSLLLGIRHYSGDMFSQMMARSDSGVKFENRYGDDQGFVDQWGNYMTREQAYVVAKENGQIIRPEACPCGKKLYTEGLY